MAGGWVPDGAVQDQIDDTVADAVMIARARMPVGESETYCAECGEPVSFRREVMREGRTLCRACAGERYYTPA